MKQYNINRIIRESLNRVISESKKGLKSEKLYQIAKEHGGLGDNRLGLGHGRHHRAYGNFSNLTDEDIIGAFTYPEAMRIDKRYAEEHGFDVNRADEISTERLGDGYVLVYIERGMYFTRPSYQPKEGDYKSYYDKTESRRKNRQLWKGDNEPTRPVQKAARALRNNPYIWSQKKDRAFQHFNGDKEEYGNGWTNAIRKKAINYARQGKDAWGYDM